jgi:alpha-beta hydrolase superfamily lysophospholipase
MPDYSAIDDSSLLGYVFYPGDIVTPCPENAFDLSVPVGDGVQVACRCYAPDRGWPVILYFHGNGEMVSDYDRIAPFFTRQRLNLVVADYRGYGASTGEPTLQAVAQECHLVLSLVRDELRGRGFADELWVMGRSLGSISAIELGYRGDPAIRGLIIESGFECIVSVLRHLDLPVPPFDSWIDRIEASCRDMARAIRLPVLIIHGEDDQLVPLAEAKRLYDDLTSEKKELVVIPDADHNSIFFADTERYFAAIRTFVHSG